MKVLIKPHQWMKSKPALDGFEFIFRSKKVTFVICFSLMARLAGGYLYVSLRFEYVGAFGFLEEQLRLMIGSGGIGALRSVMCS